MRTICLLFLSALTITADDWLYTPDLNVAEAFVKALDERCGYPNTDTKTYTSVSITTIASKDATNYAVLVPSVYSPLSKAYLSAKTVLPADRQADVALTDETKIASDLAIAQAKTPPKSEKGTLSIQKFVLVSSDVVTKATEPAIKEPIEPPIKTK